MALSPGAGVAKKVAAGSASADNSRRRTGVRVNAGVITGHEVEITGPLHWRSAKTGQGGRNHGRTPCADGAWRDSEVAGSSRFDRLP